MAKPAVKKKAVEKKGQAKALAVDVEANPFGTVQAQEEIAPGIVEVLCEKDRTGMGVAEELNAKIPLALRASNGWYEGKRDWAAVYFCLKDHILKHVSPDRKAFDQEWRLHEKAAKIIAHWNPEVYEKLTKQPLPEGQSTKKEIQQDNKGKLSQDIQETSRNHSPRFSASGVPRYSACGSALAKEIEVAEFVKEHGLDGLPVEESAKKGTDIHALLKEIPYTSKELGIGKPFKLWDRILKVAADRKIKLQPGDVYYCLRAIQKRDALISHVIKSVKQPVQKIEYNFDTHRIHSTQLVEVAKGDRRPSQLSALADVSVKVTGADGGVFAGVVDFKSGFGAHEKADTNKQLMSIASITSEDPGVKGVFVALLDRETVAEPLQAAFYNHDQLREARLRMAEVEARTMRQVDQLAAEKDLGNISEKTQRALYDEAKVGDHCFFCNGKVCCEKFKMDLQALSREMLERKDLLANIRRIEEGSMNEKDLSNVLREVEVLSTRYKLFGKLQEEGKEYARQLIANGIQLDGITAKPGAKKFLIKEEGTNSEKLDTTPQNVFQKLAPALPGVSKEEFIGSVCDVNPTALRAFLSDRNSIPEKDVFEKLLKRLPDNPIEIKPNKDTINVDPFTQVEEEVQKL